jgi:transposase
MAKPLVSDSLWAEIKPLLPAPKPRRLRYPGRKPHARRAALTGILFVLKTGIAWEDLPQEMGCGCGMSCWRRLQEWQAAGVWGKLHALLLKKLDDAGKLNWSRAAADSSLRARCFWGSQTGPSPVDRAKAGSKHHLLVEAKGVPLKALMSAANVNDVTMLLPLVKSFEGRIDKLYADRGYDSDPLRMEASCARHPAPAGAKKNRARQRFGQKPPGGRAHALQRCISSAACARALNAAPTFTKPSLPSAAR